MTRRNGQPLDHRRSVARAVQREADIDARLVPGYRSAPVEAAEDALADVSLDGSDAADLDW